MYARDLRSLVMDAPVPLRRLTLLIGANGIGKSSFARIIPLLQQSTAQQMIEPLQWWAAGGVDFGSFADACRRGVSSIQLGFQLNLFETAVRYEIEVIGSGEGSRLGSIRAGWPDGGSVSINVAESSIRIHLHPEGGDSIDLGQVARATPRPPGELLGSDLRAVQRLVFDRFHIGEKLSFDEWAVNMSAVPFVDSTDSEEQVNAKLSSMLATASVALDVFVAQFASHSAYIGPFRAFPERTYRPQPLNSDTLDARGYNLPMFLRALSTDELGSLNAFLAEHLGFEVRLDPDGSQHRVMLRREGQWYNLVDVGFGYSQLLPVAVQIWAGGKIFGFQRRKQPLCALIIEQPELHLHPHHQALLGRALAAAAAEPTGPVQMIETHSAALVEEVGLMVARGKLSPERVGVCCFEVDPTTGGTRVREVRFDEDGVLRDWPVGFLSP